MSNKYLEIISPEKIELLKKVRNVILSDKIALKYFLDYGSYHSLEEKNGTKITIRQFNNAAGNHAFDDHPEIFNITKDEGHEIRSIFQHYSESVNIKQQLMVFNVVDFSKEERAEQELKFFAKLPDSEKSKLQEI